MAFELALLPYAPDALGDSMSAETLAFHHGKHHQAHVDKVNAILADRDFVERNLDGEGMARSDQER
ncbi:MAG TPA: hypothetical protein VE891_03550 [Allosphingosinicella sp.]|nr:hypothetical protein [Allosphingosinicella sp.]